MKHPRGLAAIAAREDWTVNSLAPLPDPDVWLCATTLELRVISTGPDGTVAIRAYDLSGNGRDHVAAPLHAPIYDSGPPETMKFDDTLRYMAGPTSTYLQNKPFAIFVLAELTGTTPDQLYGSLNPGASIRIFDDYAEYNGSVINFARNPSFAVRTAWHDGTVYHYRHGGVEQASAAIPLAIMPFNVTGIGDNDITPTGMKLRSVLVYAQELNIIQVQAVEQWMLAECGG